jgi:Transglycosylase-like domain
VFKIGKVAVLIISLCLGIFGFKAIKENVPVASAKTRTHSHYVWRSHTFIFHKFRTRHGWKTNRHLINYRHSYRSGKAHGWRYCWLRTKYPRHIRIVCHRWHKTFHRIVRRPVYRTGGSNAWVLPRYVVMCESGGNPRAVNLTPAGIANGVPSGLYQITRPTWLAYGGGAFASEARFASVYEQGVIALRVLHGQGPHAWACW